jgi:hypothetical protein
MKGAPSGPFTVPVIVAANVSESRENINTTHARTFANKCVKLRLIRGRLNLPVRTIKLSLVRKS